VTPNLAVIGLGHMGLPMAQRLIDAGYPVRGFDLNLDLRSEFEDAGGIPRSTASEAVRDADVAILMLPSSAVVDHVLIGEGVLHQLSPGSVVVDMSSSDPISTQRLAALAAQHSVGFVDAPVSGGVVRAVTGDLTIMVGGDAETVARIRPLLEEMGSKVAHLGKVGAGHAVKSLNNLLGATSLLIAAEALEVGRAFGLDPDLLVDTFNSSTGRSWSTEYKLPTFVLPEAFNSGFALDLMVKDIRIALGLATSVGVTAGVAASTVDVWSTAMSELPSDADHTEIARWVRQRAEVNQALDGGPDS